jgi:hypothetical protein
MTQHDDTSTHGADSAPTTTLSSWDAVKYEVTRLVCSSAATGMMGVMTIGSLETHHLPGAFLAAAIGLTFGYIARSTYRGMKSKLNLAPFPLP